MLVPVSLRLLTVFVSPAAICELIEWPFFVVSLNDIEIVNLERVIFGIKSFDLALVFKDFTRPVMRIDSVPVGSLDKIKEWLNSINIKYVPTPYPNASNPECYRSTYQGWTHYGVSPTDTTSSFPSSQPSCQPAESSCHRVGGADGA